MLTFYTQAVQFDMKLLKVGCRFDFKIPLHKCMLPYSDAHQDISLVERHERSGLSDSTMCAVVASVVRRAAMEQRVRCSFPSSLSTAKLTPP